MIEPQLLTDFCFSQSTYITGGEILRKRPPSILNAFFHDYYLRRFSKGELLPYTHKGNLSMILDVRKLNVSNKAELEDGIKGFMTFPFFYDYTVPQGIRRKYIYGKSSHPVVVTFKPSSKMTFYAESGYNQELPKTEYPSNVTVVQGLKRDWKVMVTNSPADFKVIKVYSIGTDMKLSEYTAKFDRLYDGGFHGITREDLPTLMENIKALK